MANVKWEEVDVFLPLVRSWSAHNGRFAGQAVVEDILANRLSIG